MFRNVAILLALAVLLGACSVKNEATRGEGRLVILDDTGSIVTMAPDGTDVVTVADDGGGRVTYFQPIWSPDGSRISSTRSEAGTFSIEIIDVEGGDRTSTVTSSNSFYQYWSPDGSKLASLSTAGPGELGLDVFTIGETGAPTRLGEGQPLYLSWSPDSSDIVTHIGNAPLDILTSEGASPEFGASGDFLAPQWTEEGILYVGRASRRQQLMRTTADAEIELIASVLGGAVFTATPDGKRVAVLPTAGDDVGLSVVAQQAPVLPSGRLVVVDTEDGGFVEITTGVVAAFSWDPTGEKLLILEIANSGGFRWRVWEDGESRTFLEFVPSPGYVRDLVPFFDQYAQSMTPWSPDGSAFAFPGAVGGETGIWRQDLSGGDPVRISGGTWVAWSSG
jgi:dipeptidyl aminopeptidase/acylaminoacyl peptidase